jgi:flagellum-specific peptidoglycan hydrolase FlgJ
MAQSIIETGHWTSNIFKKNNNLFGMKQAYRRVNTAKGTQHNHAFYESWEESVYDYAFYQCRYLSGITNEDDYFQYLSKSYAEDPNYIKRLKDVIEKEQLHKKFQ